MNRKWQITHCVLRDGSYQNLHNQHEEQRTGRNEKEVRKMAEAEICVKY